MTRLSPGLTGRGRLGQDGPGPGRPARTSRSSPRHGRSKGRRSTGRQTVVALERAHGDRFEALADALIAARDASRTKVLLFTSCHRAEGRTTLVLALARALARRPGRTLLVDGDLGGPMLARLAGAASPRRAGRRGRGRPGGRPALIDAPDDHLTLLPLRARSPAPASSSRPTPGRA